MSHLRALNAVCFHTCSSLLYVARYLSKTLTRRCYTDADIVCSRAKLHFDPKGSLGLSDTSTEATGAGAAGLEAYKAAYKPLHPNQEKLMYFTVCSAMFLTFL